MLERSEWYDLARETNWTPTYVSESDIFPEEVCGARGIPESAWNTYDEPYKISYTEYVAAQREKDSGAYSVKAALERMDMYANADPGWISTLKEHYGAVSVVEFNASLQNCRILRFGRAGGMRNMATFGMLDEVRHGQIQLYFAHEYIGKDRQFDWAQQSMHTNNWVSLAARRFFDDMMMTRSAVDTSLAMNFSFETGFTNLQFIGLASDATHAGDFKFAKLIQSIQSDEARHAQIGTPTLKILIENGKKAEAQKMIDISFWRSWKLFAILTGIPMDYYLPLDKREGSFKEFMQEWIITQFSRSLEDLGLAKPWYWDRFMRDLDSEHHGQQLGTWSWRPTLWWNPAAGVGPDERDWLEEKYPGWNDTFGKCWDVIIDNAKNGHFEKTVPNTLPIVCNLSQNPIVGIPGRTLRTHQLDYQGRRYHFGSEIDQWIFEQDPARYARHQTITDRFLAGQIAPADLSGVLQYMGLGVLSDGGKDAHDFAWIQQYQQRETLAA